MAAAYDGASSSHASTGSRLPLTRTAPSARTRSVPAATCGSSAARVAGPRTIWPASPALMSRDPRFVVSPMLAKLRRPSGADVADHRRPGVEADPEARPAGMGGGDRVGGAEDGASAAGGARDVVGLVDDSS